MYFDGVIYWNKSKRRYIRFELVVYVSKIIMEIKSVISQLFVKDVSIIIIIINEFVVDKF